MKKNFPLVEQAAPACFVLAALSRNPGGRLVFYDATVATVRAPHA
jgi:hypothetical protein